MSITRMRIAELSSVEREDVQAALSDPQRFHSDGRAIGLAAIMLPIFGIPLAIVLGYEAESDYSVYGSPLDDFPRSLFVIERMGPYLGILAIVAGSIALAAYAIITRNRHGHLITNFAVIRIRGPILDVLRYADVAEVGVSSRRPPQHRVITDELEVKAKNGKSLSLYGFGLGSKRALIEEYRAKAVR